MTERNEKVLNVFKESIEKLKTIELHPRMQTAKEKYLIDIYFEESKMNVWKDKCVKCAAYIASKIKPKNEIIIAEKNKIRAEKTNNIKNLRNEWNGIILEYDKFIQEKETITNNIITTLYEDLKNYQKNLILLNESIDHNNYGSLDEVFENFKNLKIKYSTYKELILNIQQQATSIEEFFKKMKNLLIKSSIKINLVFTNYHSIKKNLLETMEKLEKYSQGIVNLEKDFGYLSNPSFFPQSYQASIIEIKRRLIFNKNITKDFEKIKQLVVKENQNRRQFIQDYGKYLTHDYVPQLKFCELKLSIEYINNDEINNLPYLLEDGEDNPNNNGVNSDYDEISYQNTDSLVTNKNQNTNLISNATRKNSEEKETPSSNNKNKNSSRDLVTSTTTMINNNNDYEESIRILNSKIAELEIINNVKEAELKKILSKLDLKDRKITYLQSETEKMASTLEKMSENFFNQLSYKDQKMKEKTTECENLLKIVNSQSGNKLDNCPMCKEIVTNSIDFQGWSNYVKDYHEKIMEKNKILNKFEGRYQELVLQTAFIKKTYFNHLHSVIESKNVEISIIKAEYESKLNTIEREIHSSKEDNKLENTVRLLEEEVKSKNNSINTLENKIKELKLQLNNLDNLHNKLKNEVSQTKKALDEAKLKENNLLVDIKSKDARYDHLMTEIKNQSKIIDSQKKNINELSEEIIAKVKELSNIKCQLDNKQKLNEELEKALENYKHNHIETLNEVHKANTNTIEKLNSKIEELTQVANDKFKFIEELKFKNQELQDSYEKKVNEANKYKENLEKLIAEYESHKRSCEERNTERLNNCEENNVLKKKLEEIQNSLVEKEKKLNEATLELTKFFSTTDNYLTYNNKTNVNTNDIISDNININNNSLTMQISNLNLNNLSKFLDVEEFIHVKRLERGLRSIFVPHSPGVYVCIHLNPSPVDTTSNFEANYEYNKFYKCNAILNLECIDNELKELLL